METDLMVDILADDPSWGHATATDADGLALHYVRWGEGAPRVLLLHGWPRFWYDWRRVLPRLAPFMQLPQADALIGHDRETVRLYLSYFYDHWLGNKAALRPVEFEEIVTTYVQPGAVRGSIAWCRSGSGSAQLALATAAGTALPAPPITQPTQVLWGEVDPILPAAWADRLGETFVQLLGVQTLPGIGHFVPFEAPEVVVEAIRTAL
jgi:pimeloyl-ACP methyl ester carboxylesterase